MNTEIILKNKNGVIITQSKKYGTHYMADNAQCACGFALIVAPNVFHAAHEPGDPVMVCDDHGVCQYRFSDLIIGKQDGAKRL